MHAIEKSGFPNLKEVTKISKGLRLTSSLNFKRNKSKLSSQ
jgi:hypothetical protein